MEPNTALVLRQSISRFACPVASPPTPLRRSSRVSASVKAEVKSEPLDDSASTPKPKRKGLKEESDGSPRKKFRPIKRGYADPGTYAHLNALSDCLALSLDVVFCGINPGCMSASKGHHFANPTNHFWKGLHLSGFTPRLLSPSEDTTLPALYSLGLTNLVERPSAEQAELSKEEMKQSVPSFKAKVINYRPRILCFVGKGIWLIVEAIFKKQILDAGPLLGENDITNDTLDELDGITAEEALLTPKRKTKNKRNAAVKYFDWGLQPYKLVYTYPKKEENAIENGSSFDAAVSMDSKTPVNETVFFVMPATSGRVVSHQLSDKVKLFARLRSDLENIKCNTLDTAGMVAIPLA